MFFKSQKSSPFKVLKSQKIVIRSNCMDCLDRTNIVQSVISKDFIIKILKQENNYILHDQFETALNYLWWKNGHLLSLSYAGTHSLKSDILM